MTEEQLPEGWSSVPLTDLALCRMGKTILARQLSREGIPVYSAGQENEPWGYISESDLLFGNTSVVLSARGSIGFPKLPRCASFVSTQTTIAATFPSRDLAEFGCYWLQTVDWPSVTSGATIPMLTIAELRLMTVPLPPLAEQKRIVAKVEELLAGVNAARERLARLPIILKSFRRAVLAGACEGRLTEDWRETDVPASSNPLGGTQDEADLPDLPEGWRWVTVRDAGEVVTGNTPSKKDSRNYGGRIPFFKPTDLNAGYEVSAAREFLSEAGARSARVLSPLAVMVTCIGATIGKTGLSRVLAATNQQINSVEVDGKQCSPFWLFWVFSSNRLQERIKTNASETTLPILNKSRFGLLPVPLPPIPEQHEIVRRVEALFKLADAIAKRVATATARAEKLTQAILAKAFRGELVPTEAELARREGREYDAAAILLERLRADRSLPEGAPRRRKD